MKTWQKGKTYEIVNPTDFIGHSKGLSIINQKIFEKIKNWPFTVVKTEDITITSTLRVTKVNVHTNRGDRLESVDLTTKDLMYFAQCRKPSWTELQHMAYDGRKPETGFKQFAQAEAKIKADAKIIKESVNSQWPFSPEDKLKAVVTEAANDPDMKAQSDFFISISGTINLSVKTEAERIKAIQFLEGIKINADV